jgi:importin subunit beta-1
LAVSQDIRQPCKDIFLQTLGSTEGGVASAAAQAIAAIASIELPFGQWPEVVPKLLQLASHGENVQIRVAALRAIGFICEKESFVKSEYLASCSNEILTAVVQGVRKEEQSEQVQEAAIKALYNSLKFIDTNFSREGERNYIMQVVCEATQSGSEIVQVTAFECLVEIMGLYYEYMEFYMERALFGVSESMGTSC